MRKTEGNKSIKHSKVDMVFNLFNYVFLAMVALIVLYPLYIVLIASVSDPYAVMRGEVLFWPKDFNLDGYKRVLTYAPIWKGYLNTVIYTVFGVGLSVMVTLLAAYALTRNFPGKRFVTVYFMITMLFSGGIIPTFILVKNIGLYNTRLVMILLGAVGIWNLMVARTYLAESLPEELHEAAVLDGCSHFQYFARIVCPLSKAIIAVLVIYYGIAQWNEYMKGVIYLRDIDLKPLQVVIRNFLGAAKFSTEASSMMSDISNWEEVARAAESVKYAIIVVATAPMLVLYTVMQKYFVQGVMIGSLKG